jgi:hypothetical protein
MQFINLIWIAAGFLLTLFVLSYIFGDNALFRFATSVFIGVTAGYVAVIVIYQVLIPKLILPLIYGTYLQKVLQLIPFVLGVLLIFKLSPRFSKVGNLPMGYLVGAGAAVLIGGAIFGTLFPQVSATIQGFSINSSIQIPPYVQLISALVILIGAVSSLAFFQFGASQKPGQPVKRAAIVTVLAKIGQIFISITLGALLAGVFIAALSALVERLGSMWTTISGFIK